MGGRGDTPSGALTRGSIARGLLSLAWPILCSGIVGVLDTAVNSMWVGRVLGDVALAAVSNANLLWTVLFSGSFGISMAGAVRIGKSMGRGDIDGAKRAVGATISSSVLISVVCVVPMAVWTRPLLESLGTPPESLPQAVIYLRVLLLSVPASYLYGAVVAALRAAGDSKIAFHFSVALVLTDALLNPLFIMGLGPAPALGIAGSALATVGSQALGATLLVVHLYYVDHELCIRSGDLHLLRMDRRATRSLLREGGPMAVQFVWVSVEGMVIISLVNRFGADVTAAYGLVLQVWRFILMPAAALGLALTSILAQNIGADEWARVREATLLALTLGSVITAVLAVLLETFGWRVFCVFLPTGSAAVAFANQLNRQATWSLVLVGAYSIWVGVLRATGAVWAPLAISAIVLAVRYPVTAAFLGRWQARAIWWSFPASAALTGVLTGLHGCVSQRARRPLASGIGPSLSS